MGERVSVVIPCYNQAHYLYDAIDCLARSTHTNLEIIIINDGSTLPDTSKHLAAIRSKYAHLNLNVMNQENRGPCETRNRGIRESTGAFIQLLDADDLIDPKKIEVQLTHFSKNQSIKVVLSDYYFASENLSYYKEPERPTIAGFRLDALSFLTNWEKSLTIPIHCPLFRREVFDHVRFRNELAGKEDWGFWVELADFIKSEGFFYHPERYAIYRINSKSMTQNPERMMHAWIKVQIFLFKKYGHLLGEARLAEELRKNNEHIEKTYIQHNQRGIIFSLKRIVQKILFRFNRPYNLAAWIYQNMQMRLGRDVRPIPFKDIWRSRK